MSQRAEQMSGSVSSAARSVGFDDVAVAAVERALALAMRPRVQHLDDDHHPAFLHPGRSALVLLRDVGAVDPSVVLVAVLHESTDPALRVAPDELAESVGPATAAAVGAIPLPGDEQLVERLISLGPGSSLAALAERLDQLRHLHLRDDLADGWADAHEEVTRAWLPFAARTHQQLAVRYAHWARTFVRRI